MMSAANGSRRRWPAPSTSRPNIRHGPTARSALPSEKGIAASSHSNASNHLEPHREFVETSRLHGRHCLGASTSIEAHATLSVPDESIVPSARGLRLTQDPRRHPQAGTKTKPSGNFCVTSSLHSQIAQTGCTRTCESALSVVSNPAMSVFQLSVGFICFEREPSGTSEGPVTVQSPAPPKCLLFIRNHRERLSQSKNSLPTSAVARIPLLVGGSSGESHAATVPRKRSD